MEFSTRIDVLESKVDKLLEMLEQQRPIQKRLDNHITFIESVYSRLKGVISYLSWSSKAPQLESIEDQSIENQSV